MARRLPRFRGEHPTGHVQQLPEVHAELRTSQWCCANQNVKATTEPVRLATHAKAINSQRISGYLAEEGLGEIVLLQGLKRITDVADATIPSQDETRRLPSRGHVDITLDFLSRRPCILHPLSVVTCYKAHEC